MPIFFHITGKQERDVALDHWQARRYDQQDALLHDGEQLEVVAC